MDKFKEYIISIVEEMIEDNKYNTICNSLLSHADMLNLFIDDCWYQFKEDNNINIDNQLSENTTNEIIREIIPMVIPGILSIMQAYAATENIAYTRDDGKIIVHEFQINNILPGIRRNGKVIAKVGGKQ